MTDSQPTLKTINSSIMHNVEDFCFSSFESLVFLIFNAWERKYKNAVRLTLARVLKTDEDIRYLD